MSDIIHHVTSDTADMWSVLQPDLANGTFPNDYHVQLEAAAHSITIDIARSPGGGYEGGYGSTNIRAALSKDPGFVFVIHPEDFLNRIGKLFGMEDVILGYEELDRHVIVKTNDAPRLKNLISNDNVRQELQRLSGYSFKIDSNNDEGTEWYLEIALQRAVDTYTELSKILEAFYIVLKAVD